MIGGAPNKPETIGIASAIAAVGLGVFYLVEAGAPLRMAAMNLAALLVGLAAFATVRMPRWRLGEAGAFILPGLGILLLATAVFGARVEGAARWVTIGPLSLQLSLILLPSMLIGFARDPRTAGASGIALAAAALALQPDRAMAAALLAGLAALALYRRDRLLLILLGLGATGFAITLVRPDELPAIPYVDQIFYTSFDVSPLAGAAVAGGACLLLLPTMALWWSGSACRRIGLVFAATWLTIILAAALGNYPTPVVGYGGSAIVGYLLSLALLRPANETQHARSAAVQPTDQRQDGSMQARLT